MIDFSHILYEIIVWLFLLYSLGLFLVYSWIGLYAFGALRSYRKLNEHTDYNLIATDPDVPTFSIIAPAYNEGITIVDNVRSLLSLYYHNLEIIVVNDGSRDDSIEKLIKSYALEKIDYCIQGQIPTKDIKGIYKSKNPAFKKLVVVDKVNGGKADALNVGINISSGKYLVCIDVDCILEQDAILKLAKPFLDQTDERVIACGGVIRLANNCEIENGKVVDVNLPQTWLGRFQALEYIRAFVLGRMAWSRASGLILISGAFGAFDKEIAVACGGYDSTTVGEDMELVVRMRRYMEERRERYKVVNIPDPLCWTEVPESKEILKKQRNRWMRGTIETLWKHRKLMFNPKYGKLGVMSLPYWFFFEFLGPIVEFTGYCIFILFLFLGIINWPFFFVLFALVLASGILYSIYAILVDLLSDQIYTKKKDLGTLLLTAILEPFFFHGTVVMAAVAGVRDYFRNQHSWGEMTRQGFKQKTVDEGFWHGVYRFITWGLRNYAPIALAFLLLYMLSVGVEAWWYDVRFSDQMNTASFFNLIIDNLVFALQLLLGFGVFYLLMRWIGGTWSQTVLIILLSIVMVLQFVLFLYFAESHNLLGADLFYYNFNELGHILKTSGMLNVTNIALLLIVLAIVFIPLWLASKRSFSGWYAGTGLFLLGLLTLLLPINSVLNHDARNEFAQSASISKWRYFLKANFNNYLEGHPEITQIWETNKNDGQGKLPDYAFLRKEDTKDFLGSFMETSTVTPNLVIIIVEGLGHAYSTDKGYIGNFTPFLDSLRRNSLTWENNLSSSGRTFGVLPTLLGSLPFASNGFLEQTTYQPHFNLWNILKENNFKTSFFYGGDANFDFMKKYAEFSKVDNIQDIESYGSKYKKLPASNGESWGFEDQAVLDHMLTSTPITSQPYINVLLTLSTHSPFLINNQAYYNRLVDRRIQELKLSESQKKNVNLYKKQLASIMNFDEALKQFFEKYKQRSDFENTIFLITGDHSMPEITLENKIDRYHVPMFIYSPLLKTSLSFKNTVSHFDIAPSLLAYYRSNYQLKTPDQVAWIGQGLQIGAAAASPGIPIMQSKYQLEEFVHGNYHLVNGVLFELNSNLTENQIDNLSIRKKMTERFDQFKLKNRQLISTQKLIPDSLYKDYFGY